MEIWRGLLIGAREGISRLHDSNSKGLEKEHSTISHTWIVLTELDLF